MVDIKYCEHCGKQLDWLDENLVHDSFSDMHFCNIEHQLQYEKKLKVRNKTPPRFVHGFFF